MPDKFLEVKDIHKAFGDVMFNAMTFDIGLVTEDAFEKLGEDTVYQYAFTYNDAPADTEEQKELSDDLVERLYILAATGGDEDNPDLENLNEVTGYVPEYVNQAIHFAPEDMGSDKAMGEVLLIILIAVIAFIFAITESNTIINEASVIGTLRASGYTKGEMLRHYIAVPIIVTPLAAIVGNVLGYTVFKEVVVMMYYNSYSLPTYETLWNIDAFVKTTVYPSILVILINFIVIRSKLSFSPLKFLRRDLSRSKRKKAIRLPKWRFLNRFRIRVLMQNATGYFTLALGIFFVMILLGFAVGCLILAMLLILLLTKIIIEKNTVSISMLKVLGYTSGEINSIFIRLTTVMVVIFSVIGAWLSTFVLMQMWRAVMADLSGWFEFYIAPKDYLKMIMIVIVTYIVVLFFDIRRIKRIPMTEALKSVE